MDDATQARIDQMVEDTVQKGYRDLVLPDHIITQLQAAKNLDKNAPVFDRVRLLHLNPAKRSLINNKVIQRYHKDLKNPDLLSTNELRKINIQRGEWSEADDARIKELTQKTQDLMVGLTADGFDYGARWNQEMYDKYLKARQMIEDNKDEVDKDVLSDADKLEALSRFDRWFSWSRAVQEDYTDMFATSQGSDTYSVDRDLTWLMDHASMAEFIDLLNDIDTLRDKLRRFSECMILRGELIDLQLKQAKMLADSVEQRRDVCDEMARLYFCTERIDEKGVGQGALTKTFEGIWELPDDVIRYLQTQLYMFLRGEPATPEAISFLETWGFLPAPPESGSKPSSDESPVEPSSSIATQDVTGTPAASSESLTPTS